MDKVDAMDLCFSMHHITFVFAANNSQPQKPTQLVIVKVFCYLLRFPEFEELFNINGARSLPSICN